MQRGHFVLWNSDPDPKDRRQGKTNSRRPVHTVSDNDLATALIQIGAEIDQQPLRRSALARFMRETYRGSDVSGAWDWRMAYDIMQAAAVMQLVRLGGSAASDTATWLASLSEPPKTPVQNHSRQQPDRKIAALACTGGPYEQEHPMNIAEIKAAVDAGQTVHWANKGYVVHKDTLGQYLITFLPNGSTIGLTDRHGLRLNGAEADFFTAAPTRDVARQKEGVPHMATEHARQTSATG